MRRSERQNPLFHEYLLSIGRGEGGKPERHSAEFFPSHILFFPVLFFALAFFYFFFHVLLCPVFFCLPRLTERQIFRFVPSTLLFLLSFFAAAFLGSQYETVILATPNDRGRTFWAFVLWSGREKVRTAFDPFLLSQINVKSRNVCIDSC